MAQYFTDFSGDVIGVKPANTGLKRSSSAATYTVQNEGGVPVLRYLAENGGITARGLSYESALSSGVTEAFYEIRDASSSNPSSGRFALFASDSPDNEYGVILSASNKFQVYKRINGSFSELAKTAPNISPSSYYSVRFRVTPGSPNLLQAKWWLSSADEPAIWNVDTTDTRVLSGGWSGHVGFATSAYIYYKRVGIGTNGDPAPTSAVIAGPATPINLGTTNLLATSARLNWEQG